MDEVGVPGVSLAVISDNRVVFSESYGIKETKQREAIDDSTIFEAASLSKTFFLFAVYTLVDAGKLDLDKPMYQYLPYEPLEHDSRYKLITPRMILSHCSGIENWKRYNDPNVLEIIANPGEKMVYSGEGYNYLAKVVALLLNKDNETYTQEMVFDPLQLKRSFTHYDSSGEYPGNIAVGHSLMGNEIPKMKNKASIPSSGVHTIAKDYANLLIAIFNRKYFPQDQVNDILRPISRVWKDDSTKAYWGIGFGVQYSKDDTIVFQNGNNKGFRAWAYYSVVHKCGFVFLTNSDLGISLAKALNSISVDLKTDRMLTWLGERQYPDPLFTLLKVYRNHGENALFAAIDKMRLQNKDSLDFDLLNTVSWFMMENKDLSIRLMEKNIELHPDNPSSYFNIARLHMEFKEYSVAYENFKKCKQMNLHERNLDKDLQECEKQLFTK